MSNKLAVIGGSGVATPHLVQSLDKALDEGGVTVTLIGRSERKLVAVARASNKLARGLDVDYTTSLEEGVADADVILNQVRVGGLAGRAWDEQAPTRLGLIGEESIGAGGFSLGFRTLPVIRSIMRTVERHAPDACFVNLTNPAGLILSTLAAESSLRAVSVCDIPVAMTEVLVRGGARDVRFFGTNHASAAVAAQDDAGHEILGELLTRLPNDASPFSGAALQMLGFLPSPYLRYLYFREAHEPQRPVEWSRATELMEVQDHLLDSYESEESETSASLLSQRNAHWYDEIVVPLVCELLRPTTAKRFVLQVPNRGLAAFLGETAAVETDVILEGGRVTPLNPPQIPEDMRALTVQLTEGDELLRRASAERDPSLAIRSLAMNPLVNDLDKAEQFWELLRARWLANGGKEMGKKA